MDAVVAGRLRERPELIQRAKHNDPRELSTCSPRSRPVLLEWQQILNGPLDEILELLRSTSENAVRLRQSSPFAGEAFVPREDRFAILKMR